MNIAAVIAKAVCSGPVSFSLGALSGLVILYAIQKTREEQKMHQTLQEIEAMVKALEVKSAKGASTTQ